MKNYLTLLIVLVNTSVFSQFSLSRIIDQPEEIISTNKVKTITVSSQKNGAGELKGIYKYDKEGKIITEIKKVLKGAPVVFNTYSYDSNGNMIRVVETTVATDISYYGDDSTIVSSRFIKGRPILDTITETWDYGYDSDNRRISVVHSNHQGRTLEVSKYKRDQFGNVIEIYRLGSSLRYSLPLKERSSYYSCEYDDTVLISRTAYKDATRDTVEFRTHLIYNQSRELIGEKFYEFGVNKILDSALAYTTEIVYHDNGTVAKKIDLEYDVDITVKKRWKPKKAVSYKDEFQYNSNGHIIAETSYDDLEEIDFTDYWEYEYLPSGLIHVRTALFGDKSKFFDQFYSYTYYD